MKKSNWRDSLIDDDDDGGSEALKLDPDRACIAGAGNDPVGNSVEDLRDPEAPPVPTKSEAYKLARNSISLARKDMAEVADAGKRNLLAILFCVIYCQVSHLYYYYYYYHYYYYHHYYCNYRSS